MMLKNGQTYFKNFEVFTPENFKSMFGHFSTLWMKVLKSDSHLPKSFVLFALMKAL